MWVILISSFFFLFTHILPWWWNHPHHLDHPLNSKSFETLSYSCNLRVRMNVRNLPHVKLKVQWVHCSLANTSGSLPLAIPKLLTSPSCRGLIQHVQLLTSSLCQSVDTSIVRSITTVHNTTISNNQYTNIIYGNAHQVQYNVPTFDSMQLHISKQW